MPPRFAYGRTPPRRGPGAADALRNLVEIVCSYDRRLKPFIPTPRERSRLRGEGFKFQFLSRPLTRVVLADGLSPFDIDLGMCEGGYGGRTELEGPMDPLLGLLWASTLEERPLRTVAGFLLQTPDLFEKGASVGIDILRRGSTLHPAIAISYWPTESRPDDARIFLEALGVAHLADPDDLAPPKHLQGSRNLRTRDLPTDPDFLMGLSRGMERHGWTSPGFVTDCSFYVGDETSRYIHWRDRFNAITTAWDFTINGWYREGFDPYNALPDPPDLEERRHPAAAYVSRASTCEEPTIQIDVVHTMEGSFLEFQSARGPGMVRKYADLAEVEVEIWKERPSDRWRAPAH